MNKTEQKTASTDSATGLVLLLVS